MLTRYLFRLDMAKDNDQFLALRRNREVIQVYSGTPMKVGPGWIPDFVEISVDEQSRSCRLTLIELEATEIPARASCRKYLPEPSLVIVRSFTDYLDSVISQCRSTADPRLHEFESLRGWLSSGVSVSVHTAGALRTSADLVEDLPLIDHPEGPISVPSYAPEASAPFAFNGDRRLTRAESEGVRRAVRILHAVIVGRDHSGGSLKSWRNLRQKPLDRAVTKDPARYPNLHKLLNTNVEHGLRVNCDGLSAELATIWREFEGKRITAERSATLISAFFSVAVSFAEHDSMRACFERARSTIRSTSI